MERSGIERRDILAAKPGKTTKEPEFPFPIHEAPRLQNKQSMREYTVPPPAQTPHNVSEDCNPTNSLLANLPSWGHDLH